MPLTPKQLAQVAKAPAAKKQAMRDAYKMQNAQSASKKAPGLNPSVPKAQQPKRKQDAQSVPNFLDPMCPIPAPSITSDGKALPHTGLISTDFVVGSVNTSILLVTNTGSSGTVGILATVDPSGGLVGGVDVLTIPTLAAADAAGGASASRAMKFSVSVVNCSNALKRGGRVTYLNSSQRLPARTCDAATDYINIVNGIKASPYRRRINGDELVHPKHLIGFPVDNVNYTKFDAHHGTLTANEFFRHILGASACDEPSPRPMSVVAFIFDPVVDAQDYSVTIRASFYTRWPLTSVPGQSMRNIPTASASIINHVRDHAENTGNDLAHIVEGGVLATVAPRAANVARAAGQSFLARVGGALRGGAAAAADAAEVMAADALAGAEMAAPLLL